VIPASGAGGRVPRRARLAGWATVAVGAASRRLGAGGGSVIGGRVGLALAPDLLGALAADRVIALISGTNGKTTTTRLLATALGGPRRVATSAAGANLPAGLVAALATSRAGAPAVLEVDEAYLGAVAASVRPRVVLLLNLSRDQLDRVSEVRMVAARWRQALTGTAATVVANADDPLVTWAAGTAPGVVWVAAGGLWHGDAVGCPSCDGRIVFTHPDGWSCRCGFARPDPDARLEGDELVTPDGRHLRVELALPGRANRANAAMAAVAAGVLGVDEAAALGSMATVTEIEGRFATVRYGGLTARLLLAKNPAGWMELLDLLATGTDPVVIGINARVADGHDPSWLWDVAFERLAGRLVVATGERCLDLAVRLRYAGVDHCTVPTQRDALGATRRERIEYVGNYTAFQDLRRDLSAHGPKPVTGASPPPPDGAPVVAARPVPVPVTGAAVAPRRAAPGPSALRVVVIHPDLLGTYGDVGNGRVLAARAAWRGIPVEMVLAASDSSLPECADLYCVGGGEDGPQVRAAERLTDGSLRRAVTGGAAVLAVCAGYQIMGTAFPGPDGRPHDGVGLLDVDTVRGAGPRAVGELSTVVADDRVGPAAPAPPPGRLTGFENHAGVTRLGVDTRPLGRVLTGVGNGAASPDGRATNGAIRTDGAWAGRVVGTYMHGPVLARNPLLADLLLAWATGTTPAPLDDDEEEALHAERLRATSTGGAHPFGPGAGWREPWRRLVRVRRA
jgi:CobQ-like glutamine amidotransferase family enzyme/UDP-N-acetylmuramyl tripeptide synthase